MNKDALQAMGGVTVIILILLLLIAGPLLTIWALDTLFPALAIPYSWQTWCAVILLGLAMNPTARKAKNAKS